jgi:hypothetical protein
MFLLVFAVVVTGRDVDVDVAGRADVVRDVVMVERFDGVVVCVVTLGVRRVDVIGVALVELRVADVAGRADVVRDDVVVLVRTVDVAGRAGNVVAR